MKDFVVRTRETVFASFDTYSEVIALWNTLRKQHPGVVVVQDNSK